MDNLELLRAVILLVGWPLLIVGALYIFYNAYNFYKAVNSTPIAKLVPIFAITTIITMISLGLVSTYYMMSDLEDGVRHVLPIFIIWFVLMMLILIYSHRMDKKALRYNDLLIALDRSKSDFITISSHQLRTPLSGIKWITELLLANKIIIETSEIKEKINNIHHSTDKMLALISNLLYIVKLDTGKMVIHKTEFDIVHTLTSIINQLTPNSEKNNQTIKLINNISQEVLIKSDKTLIEEIIKNITSNAINHGSKNSEIKVTLGMDEGKKNHLEISINNQGEVIDKHRMTNMFERYSREEATGSIGEVGGLGLYIARSFARLINARIEVCSDNISGTTFKIKLH